MKIKALVEYTDTKLNNKQIFVGDIYDVSKERAEVIVNAGYAEYYKEEEKELEIPFCEELQEEVKPKKAAKKKIK